LNNVLSVLVEPGQFVLLLHFLSQGEKVLAGCRRIRVLKAQHFLLDSQGLLEEGFCLPIPALITIGTGQECMTSVGFTCTSKG
jgi:hypothetical protein